MAVTNVSITPDGKRAVSCSHDKSLKVWHLDSGKCIKTIKGHKDRVYGVAVTPDGKRAVSCSKDKTLKVWHLDSGKCLKTLRGHTREVMSVAVTPDGTKAVSGLEDNTLKVWDLDSGDCINTLTGHTAPIWIWATAVTPDGKRAVSGSFDRTLKVWNLKAGKCVVTLKGHDDQVLGLAISPVEEKVVSSSSDKTLKVWNLETGQCLATLEGHTDNVYCVAITPDGKRIVSGSWDTTMKVWDLENGQCLATLKGHTDAVFGVAITPEGKRVVSTSADRTLRVWDLLEFEEIVEAEDTARYTNAKVVLVGESGVGKTGLAIRLAENRWEITDSTHGMQQRQLHLPGINKSGTEREVWLWDFAGQPDYRLVHQLFMDETALALVVMDPQKRDPFEGLGHWEKALKAALKTEPVKLLVAGRCDQGQITVSRKKVDKYRDQHDYKTCIDTSAKSGKGCDELKAAIAEHIPWDRLPWTASSRLFKTLKDAVVRIKNEGAVLSRISDLRVRLQTELKDDTINEETLRAVTGLLAGQGIVQVLDFGDFVLLRPEYINNYASVTVRTARENVDEIGCVPKDDVLEGRLDYKGMERLDEADEKILLRAMLQTFLDRSLCLEEETAKGTQLVFPSYFNRDRPGKPKHPDILVTYEFSGPLDEIYSTLVVRLYYTNDFEKDELWKDAADFTTHGDIQAGLLMEKKTEESADIKVYFKPGVPQDTQVSFIKYIHEHLLKRAEEVNRSRHYICPECGSALNNEQIKRRLGKGRDTIICTDCEKRVDLIDQVERKLGSPEVLEAVRSMDEQASRKLDNESLELILEGQAKAIAGEAGQIYRDTSRSDWGIDAEIEFKNQKGEASGQRLYLQLKSGDSYTYHRKRDDKEIFTIRKKRWAEYWVSQAYPVMLVIRTSDKKIRWMNVTEFLKKHGPGKKQIVFDGDPFTARSLLQIRDRFI
jgi:small GTP-binding protein